MNMYDNERLDQALQDLKEDVPPMPEDFHAGWLQQVEAEAGKPARRTPWMRVLSAAAALVFVAGGTLLTRDSLSPSTAASQYAETASYDYGTTTGYSLRAAGGTDGLVYANGVEAAPMAKEAAEQEQKIIRNASLTITTQAFEDSLAALKQLCLDKGGWIAYEYVGDGNRRTASLTLRIPAAQLDAFLTGVGDTGRITSRSESADDVTENYYDTKARLETQQALMARLQALVTDAADLSDLLALEAQMADTQYQIDRLQASLNSTDRQVDYATVDVALREDVPSLTDPERSLAQRLLDGITTGLNACISFLGDALVFLAAALPFIGIVGVIALVVVILRKRKR